MSPYAGYELPSAALLGISWQPRAVHSLGHWALSSRLMCCACVQGYAQANGRPHNGTAPHSNSNGQQNGYRQPHGSSGRGPQHHAGAGSRPAQGAPRPGRGPNGAAPQVICWPESCWSCCCCGLRLHLVVRKPRKHVKADMCSLWTISHLRDRLLCYALKYLPKFVSVRAQLWRFGTARWLA